MFQSEVDNFVPWHSFGVICQRRKLRLFLCVFAPKTSRGTHFAVIIMQLIVLVHTKLCLSPLYRRKRLCFWSQNLQIHQLKGILIKQLQNDCLWVPFQKKTPNLHKLWNAQLRILGWTLKIFHHYSEQKRFSAKAHLSIYTFWPHCCHWQCQGKASECQCSSKQTPVKRKLEEWVPRGPWWLIPGNSKVHAHVSQTNKKAGVRAQSGHVSEVSMCSGKL